MGFSWQFTRRDGLLLKPVFLLENVVFPLKAIVDHGRNGAMNLDVHTDQI